MIYLTSGSIRKNINEHQAEPDKDRGNIFKMNYYFNAGGWSGVFAVPNSVVDNNIKLAGEAEIKVILWTLRHSGELFDEKTISEGTGIPEKNVSDAISFWIQRGVLAMEGNNMIQGREIASEASLVKNTSTADNGPAPEKRVRSAAEKRMLRPDGVVIAKRMNEDPNIKHMMEEAENILGKTLSPSLAAVLLIAHDDYSLPPEVVIVIVSYAVSVGKTGTPYIESLVKNWAESGVLTMQDAEKKINELDRRTQAWRQVSSILGIPMRSPTKTEDELSFKWIYVLSISKELIREAYERCINNIGKMQFKYMDKIITTWSDQGYTTVKDVYENEEKQKIEKSASETTTYDIKELEDFNVFNQWNPDQK